MLRKAADYIEKCNKENCGQCLIHNNCKEIVEQSINFFVLIQEQKTVFNL
jgi:hypothetical protein